DRGDLRDPLFLAATAPVERFERDVSLEAAAIPARAGFALGDDRNVADFASVAVHAAHHVALMDHRAAQAVAEVEVIVLRKLRAIPVELLAECGGDHVSLDESGKAAGLGKPLLEIDAGPSGHGRGAHEAH